MAKFGIIGAGISGLSVAHFLKKKGHQVVIIESNKQIGGAVRSFHESGFIMEYGPNSILDTHPSIRELIHDLNLNSELITASDKAKNRFIVKKSIPIALPTSPLKFIFSSLFTLTAKLRLLKEPFIKSKAKDDETLADFVRRRLGDEFLDYAINPFVAGVYAGDPKNLSVKYAFKKLFDLEKKYGSLIKGQIQGAKERKKSKEVAKNKAQMISFKKGLGQLIDVLGNELDNVIQKDVRIDQIHKVNDGWSILLHNEDKSIDVDQLIITIPSHRLKEIPFSYFKNDKRKELEAVDYPPVSIVHSAYDQKDVGHQLNGFGYLTPEKENRKVLGTLFSSSIFENRAPNGKVLFTSFIGGARQPDIAFSEDYDLLEIVHNDLNELLALKAKPTFTKIIRWKKAIPQYSVKYRTFLEFITLMEESNDGIHFLGNWVNGISMSDRISKSWEFVEQLSSSNSAFIQES